MAIIIWDRDDVLNDLTRCWFERYWKPVHPECTLVYEEITENPPYRLLGISQQKYLASLDAFRLSDLAAAMEPVPEVLYWFRHHGHKHRHIVLTTTSLDTAPGAAAWTFRHFGLWVRSFHLLPSFREGQPVCQYDADKGAYLHWLGKGDVLVDDVQINIESAKRYGIAGVLIPRPWNEAKCGLNDALSQLGTVLAVVDGYTVSSNAR